MGWGRRGFWEDHLVFGGNRGKFKMSVVANRVWRGGGRGAIENWLPVHCQWGEDKTRVQSLMGDHVTFTVTQPNSFKPHPLLPPPLILKAINKDHSLRGFIYNHVFFFFSNENVPLTHKLWHDTWEECSQNFPDDIQDENHATIIIYLFLISLCLNFPDLTSGC